MGKLGLFLIQFEEQNPQDHKFFLKYNNKLDIGNADIAIIKNKEKCYKELLIGYKTIYMNTYTVQVVDIASADKTTIFKHLSFQLWESKITGFFMKKNKDYVTVNRQGICVISLGTKNKRSIVGTGTH